MPPLISPCPVPNCKRPIRRAGLCEPHAREGSRLLILRPATPPRPYVLRILHDLDRAARVDELEARLLDSDRQREAAAERIAELEAEVERARLDGESQRQAQTAREIDSYARAGDQAAGLHTEIERLREQLQAETERRVAAERNARGADALAEAVWRLKGRPEVEQLRTPGMRRLKT